MLTLLLTVGSAVGATLDVCAATCTYSTIQSAVDASAPGDEIVVEEGTYGAFSIAARSGLTVRGADNARPVLSGVSPSGSSLAAMVVVSDSTGISLTGFEVLGGTRRGATILRSTVDVADLIVRDTSMSYNGGAFEIVTSTVEIRDSQLMDNAVGDNARGGHIYATTNSVVTLIDTDLTGGLASVGGGVYLAGSTLNATGGTWSDNATRVTDDANEGGALRTVSGSTAIFDSVAFIDNEATGNGGHIAASGGSITLIDCSIEGGSARNGGMIDVRDATLTITGGSFDGGTATHAGGWIYARSAAVSATDVTWQDGEASMGGGVWLTSSSLNLIDAVLLDGTAEVGTSGGIDMNSDAGNGGLIGASASTVDIQGGMLASGEASVGGGAIFLTTGSLTATDTVFSDNEAETSGGAIDATAGTTVSLTDTSVTGNQAQSGGGVSVRGSGTLTVIGGELTDNTASLSGGGADILRGSSGSLTDVVVSLNGAVTGGGVSVGSGGTFTATRTRWCNNEAGSEGGGLHLSERDTGALLANNGWLANSAVRGGALFVAGVTGLNVTHNTFVGNDAPGGAAIYLARSGYLVDSTIIADSVSGPAIMTASVNSGTLSYIDWWNNTAGDLGGGLSSNDSDPTHLFVDPLLQAWSPAAACDAVLWVDVDSPTLDAGSPTDQDVDDTIPSAQMPSDMGALGGPSADPAAWVDDDQDGFPVMWDCDDASEDTFPGAPELCDGIDNDCNGVVDDDAVGGVTYYSDTDGDDFGNDATAFESCVVPPGPFVTLGGDCDDLDGAINPDAAEVCDGVDNDCSGAADDAAIDGIPTFFDGDGDGFGDPMMMRITCDEPDAGYVLVGGDCDDGDTSIYPFAPELCDGVSNDCDDVIDEDPTDGQPYFVDADGDGVGGDVPVSACSPPHDVVDAGGDCDDTNPQVGPNATETCNGIDDDCDGVIDPPDSDGALQVFLDVDGDGFGDPDEPMSVCEPTTGQVLVAGDCDDSDESVNPDAHELCDTVDNDCDGLVDNNAVDAARVFTDADADGDGALGDEGVLTCTPEDDAALTATDCDDDEPSVFFGADELCDGLDNDCNQRIDDNVVFAQYYVDDDEDGFGGDPDGEPDCIPPTAGSIDVGGDCDDSDATVFPGADEVLDDGIDQDCDGFDALSDGESDRDFEPDADEPQGRSGCACDAGRAPSMAWSLVLLGLLAVRRRREAAR